MRGTEVFRFAESAASQATSHLSKVFYEEYHKEMDSMFARLHAEQEVSREKKTEKEYKKEYREKVDEYMSDRRSDSSKYVRLEFSTLAEANTFEKSLQEQGFDVVTPSISLKGKFLMEVPKEAPQLDKDGNQQYDAHGNPVTINAQRAVMYASEQTGIEANYYSTREEDQFQNRLSDRPERALTDSTTRFFRNEIEREFLGDELAGASAAVQRFNYITKKYGDQNQIHAFWADLGVQGGKEGSTGTWSGAGRRSQVATVLNNGIVVIDGNVVEDEKKIKEVLSLHESRTKIAENYAKEFASTGAKHDSVFNQFRPSSTNKKIEENTKAIKANILRQSYATGVKKAGRFDGGILDSMRDSYGLAAVALRQESGRVMTDEMLKLLNKAGDNINLSVTEQEFIKRINERGSDTVMTFDDVINATGILKRAEARDAKKPFLEEDERSLLQELVKKNDDTELGKFTLNETELKMIGGGQVKRELDAIKEDLGVDLRFKDIYGSNLTALQLTHIDKDFVEKMSAIGAVYDEATGKFIKNGVALNKEELLAAVAEAGLASEAFGHSVDALFLRTFNQKLNARGYKIKDDGSIVHNRKGITEDDILKLDRAFIAKAEAQGYNFINVAGQFDLKSLQKLSKEDLAKIGISEETRQALIRFHSDKWGGHNFDLTKKTISGFANITTKLTTGNKWVEGDREAAEAISAYRQIASTPKHIKTTVRYTKQAGNAAVTKVNAIKEKHYKSGNADAKKKPQIEKPKKEVKAKKRKVDKKKTEKYLSKQEARLLRKARSQKFWQPFRNVQAKMNVPARMSAWFNKTAVGKVVNKVAGAVKGLLIKAAAIFLGAYGIVACVILIIMFVSSTISALLNAPYEGGKKIANWIGSFNGEDRPAIVVLYETLNDSQNEWVKNLGEYDNYYECRTGINYTNSYTDYSTYLTNLSKAKLTQLGASNSNDYFVLKEDSGLKINPFYGIPVSDIESEENLKANGNNSFYNTVTTYDGKNDTQILANASIWNRKQDSSLGKGYVSVESGHTNNIKDILAMLDVMYEYSVDKFGDDEINNALGETVASLRYDEKYQDFVGKAKAIGNVVVDTVKEYGRKIINFFLPDDVEVEEEGWPSWSDYYSSGESVKWGTLQSYANLLYQTSHQEQVTLDVDFYKAKKFEANVDGTMVAVINPESKSSLVEQETASWLDEGICTSPVKNDFRIAYNGSKSRNKIYPYLGGSHIYDLSTAKSKNYAKLDITMDKCIDNKLCLWDDMDSNKTTYDKISSMGGCWQIKSEDKNVEKGNPTKYSGDFRGDWFKKKSDAEKDVRDKFSKYIDEQMKSLSDTYSLESNHNSITKDYYKKNVSYTVTTEEKEVFDHNEVVDAFWGDFGDEHRDSPKYDDDGSLINPKGLTPDDNGHPACKLIIKGRWTGTDGNYHYDNIATYYVDNCDDDSLRDINCWIDDDGKWRFTAQYWLWYSNGWKDIDITKNVDYNGYGYEYVRLKTNKPVNRKEYQGVITDGTMYQLYTDTYKRDCEGHTFEYCGGHVTCHSCGVVYSVTNEQLSAAGAYPNSEMKPQALYNSDGNVYSLTSDDANNSYSPIRGKVIKKDVDYSTVATAIRTGGAKYVFNDVQGVAPEVSPGLNLMTGTSEDGLGSGFELKSEDLIREARDIFDIDCLILKGFNVYPWKGEKDDSGKFKEPRWRQYEGWTADNMTFVALRVSNDWYGLYGFDIPLEIEGNVVTSTESNGDVITVSGVQSPTEKDINTIITKLKEQNGNLSKEREDAVKLALHWVGRGHYSSNHTEHDFLRKACKGVTYQYFKPGYGTYESSAVEACCSASNSKGFVNFYLAKLGKNHTDSIISDWNVGWGSLEPGDIYKEEKFTLSQINFTESEIKDSDWVNTYLDLTGRRDQIYGIYIGTFNENIELECGQQITAGVPVTVCLAPSSSRTGAGSIYLKSESSPNGHGVTGPTQQYFWLTNTDSSQKAWYSLDNL